MHNIFPNSNLFHLTCIYFAPVHEASSYSHHLLSGLPWFLQTCVISPGSRVQVLHKGILYSTLTLLTTVVFLIGAAHSNNWKMDKRLGGIMLFWYFVVMGVASLYETNILGDFNPVECESDW